jgi:carbamoyl-phosphate synthase large subunit
MSPAAGPMRVLIAGIAGASLGTELLKCLRLAGGYAILGCDIAPLAFGHYEEGFERTFVVDPSCYVESILGICRAEGIETIIPGGEGPLAILGRAGDELDGAGIALAANAPSVIDAFTDKIVTFDVLRRLGFPVPETRVIRGPDDLGGLPFPCIIKPATGSGGSNLVFLARDGDEARSFLGHITPGGRAAVVQEYIPEVEGEFTVGVLSLPDGAVVGSIALKRSFHSKLSVALRSEAGLISSGYSQGLIDDFPEVCRAAEAIARAVGSRGPLNVQGRVRGGIFLPFEINPRFSASTYLRALAGFNEIDLYLRSVRTGEARRPGPLRRGYYLRSLSEMYVPPERVKR